MSDTHYETDETQKKKARDLMDALRLLAKAWDAVSRQRGIMIQSRLGDGSSDADYDQVVEEYGYSANTVARASFEEIDGNWSTVDSKIQQMLNRHL